MELKCPICHKPLDSDAHGAQCAYGHHFDRSKSGYLNLMVHYHQRSGDDSTMVKTRIDFLNQGYYDFLIDTINTLIKPYQPKTIVDVACGPGYYLQRFHGQTKYGIDLSKSAIHYAAKHDPTSQYIIANGFDLPFLNESIDLFTIIFAPYRLNTLIPLLKPHGTIIIVSPGPNHLIEIKRLLYPTVYLNRNKPFDPSGLRLKDERIIAQRAMMDGLTMLTCLSMTPYRYKTDPTVFQAIQDHPSIAVTIEFKVRQLIKP